jgi:hypothetical protein
MLNAYVKRPELSDTDEGASQKPFYIRKAKLIASAFL